MDENGTPPAAPPEQAPAGGSDEEVAQGFFDEWSARIEADIEHLKQGLAQIAQVKGSNNAGPSSSEPGTTPSAGATQGQSQPSSDAAAAGGGGVQGAIPSAGESEHAPRPSHPYFRKLWGN